MSAAFNAMSLHRVRHNRATWQGFVIVGGLAILGAAAWEGQTRLLALAIIGSFAIALSIRWPMPLLLLGLLLSSDIYDTTGILLPVLVQGAGFQVSIADATTLLLLIIGSERLWRRKERPLFFTALCLLGTIIIMSSLAGIIAGTAELARILNGLRPFEPYALYIAGCGIVTTRMNLKAIGGLSFASIIIAVPFEIWQVLKDPVATRAANNQTVVDVYGVIVPYVAVPFGLYVLLGIAIAFALVTTGERWLRVPFLIGLLGLAMLGLTIRMNRQFYILAAASLVITLLLSTNRDKLRGIHRLILLTALFIPMLLIANAQLAPQFGGSLLQTVANRGGELFQPSSSESATIRAETGQQMWGIFLEVPFFGLGPGQWDKTPGTIYYNDVGFLLTLVFFGAFGLLGVLNLLGVVAVNVFRRLPTITDPLFRAYLLGSFSLLAGLAFVYISQDFFTSYPYGTVMTLLIIDRALRLSDEASAKTLPQKGKLLPWQPTLERSPGEVHR